MFPLDFPKGTTPRSLFMEILPREHARLVPHGAGSAEAAVHVEGGPSFLLRIDGDRLDVKSMPAPPEGHPGQGDAPSGPLSLTVHGPTLDRFLADWMGDKRYLPKFPPRGEVRLLTDPRLLRRLALVGARVELALTDFEGGRASLTLDAGSRARQREPDVTVEASTATFETLLAGALAPDEAIVDGHVKVRGAKLAAMKLALAFAPYFPPRA